MGCPAVVRLRVVALSAMVAVGGTLALAHHGFGGRYDRSAPIYLEGTVLEAYFGFPHAEVLIEADPDAIVAPASIATGEFVTGLTFWQAALGLQVEVEFPPVARFFALEERVDVGDRIGLVVLRNCEPPHQLRAQWVAPPTGPPVIREGTMQSEEPGGC
ncbi:MAG: hypothetical protein AAF968_16160 [Pseudomonadota bacterium]